MSEQDQESSEIFEAVAFNKLMVEMWTELDQMIENRETAMPSNIDR